MELDLVDAVPEAVVRPKTRRMLVRQSAPFERLAAEERTELGRLVGCPAGAFARNGVDERGVLEKEVVTDERRRLVRGLATRRRRHRVRRHLDRGARSR